MIHYFQSIATYHDTSRLSVCQRHGQILSLLRHLEYQWPWISLRGHPRSLILAPIKSAYGTSFITLNSCSIATLILCCHVSEFLCVPNPHSGQNVGSSPWSRSSVLECVESEHPSLTKNDIVEVFQYVITIPQRHRQRDRRDTTCRINIELCVASSCNNIHVDAIHVDAMLYRRRWLLTRAVNMLLL